VCDDDLELADINDEGHANSEAVHKEINVVDSTDDHIPIVDGAAENCVHDGINEQDTLIEAPTDTVVDVSNEENAGCDDSGYVTTPSNEEEKKVGDNISGIDDSESTKGEDNHSSSEIVLDRETVEEEGLIKDEAEGQVVGDMTVVSTNVVDEIVKDMVTDFEEASKDKNELSGSQEVTSNDDDLKMSDIENLDGFDIISNKETDTVSELKNDESAVDVVAGNESGDSICEKDIVEDQTNKESDTVSELKSAESAIDVVTEGDETGDLLRSHTDGDVNDTITACENEELSEKQVDNGPFVDPTLDVKANDDLLELANIDESEVYDKKDDCAEENINDKEVVPSIDSNVGASDIIHVCTPQMDQTTQEEDSTVSVVVDKSPLAEKELLVSHYSDDLDDMIAEFESEGRVSAECMDESTS
jgi:hypothetical protein